MAESVGRPAAELALLTAVIREVARYHRLSPVDTQDFSQHVQLRFLERNYDAFSRFSGRSSLRTYLTVVVTRILLDWRNAIYGKWRPSTAAVRLGPDAVMLDRLVSRDGYSREEAVATVQRMTRATSDSLQDMVDRLPARTRPKFVEERVLAWTAGDGFQDPVEAREERLAARRLRLALSRALRGLDPDERQLLALRYKLALSVSDISIVLNVDARILYRRLEKTIRSLRRTLSHTGPQYAGTAGRDRNRPALSRLAASPGHPGQTRPMADGSRHMTPAQPA
jgi:RNA polymerase sigma factor (sigma-70 family)